MIKLIKMELHKKIKTKWMNKNMNKITFSSITSNCMWHEAQFIVTKNVMICRTKFYSWKCDDLWEKKLRLKCWDLITDLYSVNHIICHGFQKAKCQK